MQASLGRRLRKLRHAKGWTVEQAAEAMRIEPAYVRRLEKGTTNPSLAILVSVASAFGLHPSDLIAADR